MTGREVIQYLTENNCLDEEVFFVTLDNGRTPGYESLTEVAKRLNMPLQTIGVGLRDVPKIKYENNSYVKCSSGLNIEYATYASYRRQKHAVRRHFRVDKKDFKSIEQLIMDSLIANKHNDVKIFTSSWREYGEDIELYNLCADEAKQIIKELQPVINDYFGYYKIKKSQLTLATFDLRNNKRR